MPYYYLNICAPKSTCPCRVHVVGYWCDYARVTEGGFMSAEKIEVQGKVISLIFCGEEDYVSLADMVTIACRLILSCINLL